LDPDRGNLNYSRILIYKKIVTIFENVVLKKFVTGKNILFLHTGTVNAGSGSDAFSSIFSPVPSNNFCQNETFLPHFPIIFRNVRM
jgi:hypothetical protein